MKTILDYFLTAALVTICWLLRKLPRSFALRFAALLIKILLTIYPRFVRAAYRNLELVFPDKTLAERRAIFNSSIDVLAENMRCYALIPDLNKRIVNELFDFSRPIAVFQEIKAEKHQAGMLICTAHFGNFELLVQAEAIINGPTAILARPFTLPVLNHWWNRRRELHGNVVFDRKGAYRQIEQRLRDGQDVAILYDQNVKKNHAIFVDLFGISTATTKSVALAALRTSAPLVFTVSCVDKNKKYKVIVERVPYDDLLNLEREEQVKQITLRLNAILERVILEYPDNWFWIHRRFKTQPTEALETIYNE